MSVSSESIALGALGELLGTLPAQLEATEVVVQKKVQEIAANQATLEAQRLELQPATVKGYAIGKGQNPAEVLTGDALKHYQGTLDWLADSKKRVWEILSGKEAAEKGFVPQIDSKSLRGVEPYIRALQILVLKFRDAPALAELAEIAIAIPQGAVDRYQPKPVVKDGKAMTAAAAGVKEVLGVNAQKEKDKGMEQPGLKRFCNLWDGDRNTDFTDVGTDTDELEYDLFLETIAELLYVLTVNKGFSARVDEGAAALGALYWDNLRPRREFLSKKLFPGGPLDVYGKDLLHCVVNKYLEHSYAFMLRGLPEDKAAAERMKGHLDAHFEYLTAPDGTETVVGAHRVMGRGRELRRDDGVTGLHNTVYLREHLPDLLVGNWLGLELCSDRLVNALAQTLYWHVMVEGIEGPLSANMGGGQTADDKRTGVARFRGGKTAPISKAKNWGGADTRQGLHTLTGSNLPMLAYLTGREDFRRELEALDKSKDSERYARHGCRLALLLWATEGK